MIFDIFYANGGPVTLHVHSTTTRGRRKEACNTRTTIMRDALEIMVLMMSSSLKSLISFSVGLFV